MFAYVRLKKGVDFEKSKDGKFGFLGRAGDHLGSTALHDDEYDLQQSGSVLIVRHKKNEATYHVPWNDVSVALVRPEPADAKAKGQAAKASG
jgi:hypothetical protein